MTRRLKALLLIFVGVAAVACFSFITRPREKVLWRTDFASAAQEAKDSGRPMLLDFSAQWCGPCQEMRRTTWSNAKVAGVLAAHYVPVSIDVDAHPDLAQKYGAEAIPHLVLLDPQGNVVKWNDGLLGPDEFLAWLGVQPSSSPSTQPVALAK